MQTVLDMTAVCSSLADVASYATAPTATLRAYVAACAQYCRDCAAACMESCDRCADACDALTKAA